VIEVTSAPSPRVSIPDAGPEPALSIIVVTFGVVSVVLDALAAVAAHTTVPYEVLVVDNPTEDGRRSAELLKSETSGIILVEPVHNLGFAGGNNLGVDNARGATICFMNPDVIVAEGWLPPLLAALDDPVVAVAAPVLLYPDGSLQEAGQVIFADGCTAAIGGPELFAHDTSQRFSRDVDYSSAACWVVRRSEHLERGGFDTRYHPAYFEDSDYGVRVELAGQRSRLVADSAVVHHHGAGGAGRDLAMGARSLEVFRSTWADRLPELCDRPVTALDAVRCRDRLATARVTWVVPPGSSVGEVGEALSAARSHAQANPRQRVTCIAAHAPRDTHEARAAGVEVVIGDVDDIVAQRRPLGGEWRSPDRGIRHSLRALLSPWTAVVALVGMVLRILVLQSSAGQLNADEAYTGLQAMGVLDGRFAVVVDGNRYTAVLESYLFAPVVGTVGPSILLLKLVPVLFFALAAVATYVAGCYLSDRRTGAVAGALVWITPGALLVVSTLAYVGYALGMAVSVTTLILAALLIDRSEPGGRLAAGTGASAGLAFYIHPMFAAVLIPLLVPVAWTWRRSLRSFWVPSVAAAVIVNGPFLVWNAVNGWPSLEVQNALPGTYTDRLSTFARELVPRGYGLRDVRFDWVLGPAPGLVLYGVLIAAVAWGSVTLIRRGGRRSRLLVPVVVVMVWPMMALFSPLIWSQDGRYNVIAFPFVCLAVAAGLSGVAATGRMRTVSAAVVVVAWLALYVGPHTSDVVASRDVDPNASLYELIDFLEVQGIDRVAGSYWRVLTVEYGSDRRIIGAVSPPAPARFPVRQRAVEGTPPSQVAFVFPEGAEDPTKLWMAPTHYERIVVGDTVVYLPLAPS
jgi:GT2 family glycosyltransferase